MNASLAAVLPVFALIAAGWLARRAGVLGPGAVRELNRFVVWLALPALLFDITAHASWSALWQPGFVLAFGGGSGLVFAAIVLLRVRAGRPLPDAALDGLNGAYANTGFMGFSLAVAALGRDALPLALVATVLTACVLFAIAIVLIELGRQAGRGGPRLVWTVASVLARNPLLVSPAAGVLVAAAGWPVPAPIDTTLKLLAPAASPCALVTLGLFLAGPGTGTAAVRPALLLSGCKLLLQPALSWLLATFVFRLPPLLAHAAILLAALPTGTGPFMLAEFYGRDAGLTGRVVLLTTVASVLTVSAYLAALR